MTAMTGAVVYRGPSTLTGAPIVCILTGLTGNSSNPKTGPMVQSWVLRADMMPMDAVRANVDDAICGDCALRGRDGYDRRCYVPVWVAATAVWKSFAAGQYLEATADDASALLEARHLRLCAYGDPAAMPFNAWRSLLRYVEGWVGYTHAWRTCDPRFKTIAMASVDSLQEYREATAEHWRTFRTRPPAVRAPEQAPIVAQEFACPASDEMQHRTTCQHCQLCRGTSSPARSVAIVAHGHNGAMSAWRAEWRRSA